MYDKYIAKIQRTVSQSHLIELLGLKIPQNFGYDSRCFAANNGSDKTAENNDSNENMFGRLIKG